MKRTAIFREGYNDRIAYRAGAKDAFYRYIKDNPYRYVIRKMHPEFFGNTLDLKIGDTWLQLYGSKGCLCRLLSARRSGNTGTRP